MSTPEKDELDDRILRQFIKILDGSDPQGKIGVLGGSKPRSDGGPTNAEIGLKHEFGKEGMPTRSWLRVPLMDHLEEYLDRAGFNPEAVLKQVLADRSLRPLLEKIMVVCKRVVLDGFASCGFGKWPPSDMTHKKNHQTLVETGQLRNSVETEIKGG